MFTQIVYTSRPCFATRSAEGRALVENMVEHARISNAKAGITGFLLVGDDWIAQIIEGDANAIYGLLERLLADPRHTQLRVLDSQMVPARAFPDWNMGMSGKALDELPLSDLADRVRSGQTDARDFSQIIAIALAAAPPSGPEG